MCQQTTRTTPCLISLARHRCGQAACEDQNHGVWPHLSRIQVCFLVTGGRTYQQKNLWQFKSCNSNNISQKYRKTASHTPPPPPMPKSHISWFSAFDAALTTSKPPHRPDYAIWWWRWCGCKIWCCFVAVLSSSMGIQAPMTPRGPIGAEIGRFRPKEAQFGPWQAQNSD